MTHSSQVFETHYADYCSRLAEVDFRSSAPVLGTEIDGGRMIIPFFNRTYRVSGNGIADPSGKRPDYTTCVILAKYILLCPDTLHHDGNWVSFKDFKRTSHFTNVNYFKSDTEDAIAGHFSGRMETLSEACAAMGGTDFPMPAAYDLSMRFQALPRISLLLLMNDRDDEFPAQCKVLFQKQAEFYLDPESLAMVGAVLAANLKTMSGRSVLR